MELLREIKYVICCYGNTRPIRKVSDINPARNLIIQSGNGLPFMPMSSYQEMNNKNMYS